MNGIKNDKVALLEQLYIAAHVIDDLGQILWANPFEVNSLGYTPEEFIGHNFSEVKSQLFYRLFQIVALLMSSVISTCMMLGSRGGHDFNLTIDNLTIDNRVTDRRL